MTNEQIKITAEGRNYRWSIIINGDTFEGVEGSVAEARSAAKRFHKTLGEF